MARIANRVLELETGDPFTTGNATILGPDGGTLATPALDGTTGRYSWQANGQPGITTQEYDAGGQVKKVFGDSYGQAGNSMLGELDELLQMFSSGVITGMTLSAPGGMSVQVAIGKGLNLGVLHPIYTAENVTISAADASNPRIDRIVSRLTRTGTFAGKVALAVVKGTAASSPVAPALTQTSATWEFEVGRVTVPAAASSISVGNLSVANAAAITPPIGALAILTSMLADASITTAKIADGNVTLAKLATGVLQPALSPGLQTNFYVSARSTLGGSLVSMTRAASLIYATPIYIPADTTVTRIGCNILEAVNSYFQYAIYDVGDDGGPGNKVYGTTGGTLVNSSGFHQLTISQALSRGWYWLATAGSFGVALTSLSGGRDIFGSASGPDASTWFGALATFSGSVISNGMPSTFPSYSILSAAPLVFIRTSGS